MSSTMKVETQSDGSKRKVVITVEFDTEAMKTYPISPTGKTRSIASTRGNVPVENCPDEVRLGLNMYYSVPKEERRG